MKIYGVFLGSWAGCVGGGGEDESVSEDDGGGGGGVEAGGGCCGGGGGAEEFGCPGVPPSMKLSDQAPSGCRSSVFPFPFAPSVFEKDTVDTMIPSAFFIETVFEEVFRRFIAVSMIA